MAAATIAGSKGLRILEVVDDCDNPWPDPCKLPDAVDDLTGLGIHPLARGDGTGYPSEISAADHAGIVSVS